MPKQLLNIKSLGGIDTRHTAAAGRMRGGKNFQTRGGALMTRPGCSELISPLVSSADSLFQAGMPTKKTRLLVQEGTTLWHRFDTTWSPLKDDLEEGKTLKGCRFIDKLILVNGPDRYQYDISTGSLASLVSGPDPIPNLEYVVSWKSRIFGWAPSYSGSNFLRFCGYDSNDMIDPAVWPADFSLDVSRDSSSPILSAIPSINHLLVLAKNGYWQIYGDTEEDFSIQYGGTTSVVSPSVCASIGNLIFWLGVDRGQKIVYVYSGTTPEPVSEPIADLLQGIDVSSVYALCFNSQYWLVSNSDHRSKVFVFDTTEGEWYVHEYPFTITCGSMFGEYMSSESMVLGTGINKLAQLDSSIRDLGVPIITEFMFEIEADSRQFKSRTLSFNACPNRPFQLEVLQSIDGNFSQKPVYVTFDMAEGSVTESIKLSRLKGRTCSIKVRSEDRIDELQKISLVIKPKAVR